MERVILQPPQGAEFCPVKLPGPEMRLLAQRTYLSLDPYSVKLLSDILGTKEGLQACGYDAN